MIKHASAAELLLSTPQHYASPTQNSLFNEEKAYHPQGNSGHTAKAQGELEACSPLEIIEAAIDLEAAGDVCNDYQDALPDFKVLFDTVYAQHAEEANDTSARLDYCMDDLLAIEKDTAAAFP